MNIDGSQKEGSNKEKSNKEDRKEEISSLDTDVLNFFWLGKKFPSPSFAVLLFMKPDFAKKFKQIFITT